MSRISVWNAISSVDPCHRSKTAVMHVCFNIFAILVVVTVMANTCVVVDPIVPVRVDASSKELVPWTGSVRVSSVYPSIGGNFNWGSIRVIHVLDILVFRFLPWLEALGVFVRHQLALQGYRDSGTR